LVVVLAVNSTIQIQGYCVHFATPHTQLREDRLMERIAIISVIRIRFFWGIIFKFEMKFPSLPRNLDMELY
jgi:hypothetical protein